MAQILVFGDSIAYGAWDKEGGWVQRLRKFIDEKNLTDPDFECLIYNLGIDGDTTEGLLKRFEIEVKPRLLTEETIFIFRIGTNDSCFIQSKNIYMMSQEKFKENIQKLIKVAQKFSSKIVFIGLTPVEEARTTPIPWSRTGKSYTNENIKKYDEIIKSVSKENQIYFIDIFKKFIKSDYKKLLADGLHPNSQGHQKIFEIIRDFLAENKIV